MTKNWFLLDGVPPVTYDEIFVIDNVLYASKRGEPATAMLKLYNTGGVFHKTELNQTPHVHSKIIGYSVNADGFKKTMSIRLTTSEDPQFWAEILYT